MRRRGDHVLPVFAPLDDEHRALARELVALWEAHVGRPKRELDEHVARHELRLATRFKLARGLATLLGRRSRFEAVAPADPGYARMVTYEESARLFGGAATTPEARAQVLAAAAARLRLAPDEVERAMAADAEEEQVLVAFEASDPDRLLLRYNLALAQTLLFDAVRLEVTLERGFREFLGLVKLHGLMHVVTREPEGTHRVLVDGPVSLFRDTRRYGTAMAKVVPALARCGRWSLAADVQDAQTGQVRQFVATSETLPMPRDAVDEVSYDSETERRFAQGWAGLRGEWRALREPAALTLEGGELFLPDFGFAWRDGPMRAYLEIVGYWTPRYLERKLEKLRKLRSGEALLLAVDAELGVAEDAFAQAPADVLFYRGEVPLVPVLQWLKSHEEALVDHERATLAQRGLASDAPVVTVDGLAREHDVSAAAVEAALPASGVMAGRVRLGNALVREDHLAALAARLAPGMALAEVERLAGDAGITDSASLLSHLGYVAAWKGLDPTGAVLRRKDAS